MRSARQYVPRRGGRSREVRLVRGLLLLGWAALTSCSLAGGEASSAESGGQRSSDSASAAGERTLLQVPDGVGSLVGGAGGTFCTSSGCMPTEIESCNAGLKCVLQSQTPTCISPPAASDGNVGESCSAANQCRPGLACFSEGNAGQGRCRKICCPYSTTACGGTQRCAGTGRLVGAPEIQTAWGGCLDHVVCDLLDAVNSCGGNASGEGCYIVSSEGRSTCLRKGSGGAGSSCMAQNECAPGFVCAGLGDPRCVRVCALNDPQSCPAEEGSCQPQIYSPNGTGICTRGS